jgi:hypothetical protein
VALQLQNLQERPEHFKGGLCQFFRAATGCVRGDMCCYAHDSK